MSKSKIVVLVALIILAFGMTAIGNAVAGERVKSYGIFKIIEVKSHQVEDAEGHVMILYQGEGLEKGIGGEVVTIVPRGYLDYTKGKGPFQGYTTYTFRDGSTIVSKWQGKATVSEWKAEGAEKPLVIRGGKGTYTYIAGTGKYQGIEGKGTFTYTALTPEWIHYEGEGEYTLPER